MSDALRDLIVSIDFNEVDVSKLTRIDKAMDSIEDNLRGMGADITRMGDKMDKAGDEGRRSLNQMGDAADHTSADIKSLGNMGDKALKEVKQSAGEAEKALKEVGDAAEKSGGGGSNRWKILDILDEVVPHGRAAGAAAMLFSNPWVIAGAAVVGAIGGVTLVLGHMAVETDKAMDRIQALTGATGKELAGLQGTARAVFASGFGESLSGVGDDISSLHGKFKDLNNDALGKLQIGLYTLQGLWPAADIEATTQAIKTMKANFSGLSETDAIDLITFGFQNGGDYAGDLLDTMKEYAPQFSKMGMGAEKMTGILLRGSEAGAWNMDKVGDAVKEMGIRAIDGSKGTADAFKALGFDAKKMSGDFSAGGKKAENAFAATVASLSFVDDATQQNILGVQLFGTQWEDVGKKVIFSMDGAEKAVEGFEGATKRAGDAANDNVGSKWSQITRTIKQDITDALGGDGEDTFPILDNVIASLPKIKAGIDDFAGWFKGLFAPGTGVSIYLEGFADIWSGVWDAVLGIWNIIGPLLMTLIGGTFDNIFTIAGTSLKLVGDIFSIFGNLLQGNWGEAWQGVKDLFDDALQGIKDLSQNALDGLLGIWNTTFGRIFGVITAFDLKQAGVNMIDGLIDGVLSMKDYAIETLSNLAGDMWDGFTSYFKIHSPSRLMMEGGEFIVKGLSVGIDKTAQDAIDAATNMSKGVAEGSTPQLAQFGPSMTPGLQSSQGISETATAGNVAILPTSQQGGTSQNPPVVVNMPITVNVPEGTSAQDSQGIGAAVAAAVNERLAAIFTQLNIKLA